MHANFSGILNIWSLTSDDLFNYLINGDKIKEPEKKEETADIEEVTNSLIRTSFDEENNIDEIDRTE